jgi:hypothetical protein
MGNDDANAAFEEISKFTSVEQYREFLEKELGEDRLMKAYPLLKEFVSYSYQVYIFCLGRPYFVFR